MIRNHKLIIDKNCPLCGVYSKFFTAVGLIDKQTVAYYQHVNRKVFEQIDPERAKSEVAFVNPRSGKTVYGVDTFLHILSYKKRFLSWLFGLQIVRFFATKSYRFISFNRHVISGVRDVDQARNCTPPVHLFYRWSYLIFAAILTGLAVNHFAYLLDSELGVVHLGWREYLICFGQILWQFGALSLINPAKRLDYLGNMSTVSIVGALLLLPLFAANYFMDFNWLQLLVGFSLVVGTMFLIHVKRCKRLGLPFIVSISWVSFRTIVLIMVLTSMYF